MFWLFFSLLFSFVVIFLFCFTVRFPLISVPLMVLRSFLAGYRLSASRNVGLRF
jgi:hypothetical protein